MARSGNETGAGRRVTYNVLLWCLLGLLAGTPVAQDLGFGTLVLNIGLGVVLLAAIREEGRTSRRLIGALLLGTPAVLGRFVAAAWHDPPVVTVVAIFAATGLFLAYVIYHMLSDVMSGERVTTDKLKGAICIYLLVGMAWWVVYGFVEYLEPGSFSIPAESSATAELVSESLYYFSFVTLTTLGYGDITPVSHYARNYAILEAIIGQLFIAVMIARLVGMQASQKAREG